MWNPHDLIRFAHIRPTQTSAEEIFCGGQLEFKAGVSWYAGKTVTSFAEAGGNEYTKTKHFPKLLWAQFRDALKQRRTMKKAQLVLKSNIWNLF